MNDKFWLSFITCITVNSVAYGDAPKAAPSEKAPVIAPAAKAEVPTNSASAPKNPITPAAPAHKKIETPSTNAKAPVPPKPINPVAPTEAQLSALVDIVQKQYDRTTSASFDFEQLYSHRLLLATTEKSKGQVFFTPGNMLWRYNEPEERKKEFYIEGRKFTYHLVNDKQAFTHNCFEKDTLSASITFLWGKGKLKQSFTIQAFQGPITNNALKWFTLIPKEKNASVKSISLGVDGKTGVVMESIVTDLSDGINSFRFSNYKTNPKLAAQLFHFVPAKGVKVEPMPNVECNEKPPISNPPKTPPHPTK